MDAREYYALQAARKRMGLTQRELAEKTGVSLSIIQKYEQGTKDINKAGLAIIQKMCDVLDCRIDDLIDFFDVVQDPTDKVVALFENLTSEEQVTVLKTCAKHIGWTVNEKK